MSITEQPDSARLDPSRREDTGFDVDAPGAPVFRYTDQAAKDRLPMVRYGAPSRLATGQRFTGGESWLINQKRYRGQDRYLLGSITDDDAHTHPIESRPSLVRLAVATMYGIGILIERPVSAPVLAVIASLGWPQRPVRLMVTTKPETRPAGPRARTGYKPAIKRMTEAVDTYTLSQQADALRNAASAMMVAGLHEAGYSMLPGDTALARLLGVEGRPLRDYEHAARAVDHLQTRARWSDKDIRHYLALHGFVNASGNIGVWNHDNLQRLRDGA